jgi:acetyltransferase
MCPQGVVLVGASNTPGSIGFEVLKNLLESGYNGNVFLLNPKYAGQPCSWQGETQSLGNFLASPSELPMGSAELAVLMTRAETVPELLSQLADRGVTSAVILSAGFEEIGPAGEAVSAELKAVLARTGQRVIGPNCVGILNTHPSHPMNLTFAPGTPPAGHAGVISQSGAVGIDLISRARRLGIGVGQFFSVGNQTQVTTADLLRFWQHTPEVRYILGYLEALGKPPSISELQALTLTKPVVVIKSGRSQAGAKAATSHTGSLAGSDQAADALFRKVGIQRVHTIEALFSAAQAFENCPPLQGNRVAIFSNAGGYAVMSADALEDSQGLTLASFNELTTERLRELLPSIASPHNPVDVTGAWPGVSVARYQQALTNILADPSVDACIVVLIPVLGLNLEALAESVSRAAAASGKPVLAVFSMSEERAQRLQQHLQDNGSPPIALYITLRDAVAGLSALNERRLILEHLYLSQNERPIEPVPPEMPAGSTARIREIFDAAQTEGRQLLTAAESMAVLAACGIPVAENHLVRSLPEALAAGAALGYPLVLKLNSKTQTHKTDVGGVVTDIHSEQALREAFEQMMARLSASGLSGFGAGEGILVQRFLGGGREMILGVQDEAPLGKLLMVGRGGTATEIERDVQFGLAPLTRDETRRMLRRLKGFPLLEGFRGQRGMDLPSLEDALMRLSTLVLDFPEIEELDVNPWLGFPPGQPGQSTTSLAVDARIVLQTPSGFGWPATNRPGNA